MILLAPQNRETIGICKKCGIRHQNSHSIYCPECRPKFKIRICRQHTFNILNMNEKREIKCDTEFCNEIRKG
jgi:hypothetical protein